MRRLATFRVTVDRYVPRGTRMPFGARLDHGTEGYWTLSFGIRNRVGFSVVLERVS